MPKKKRETARPPRFDAYALCDSAEESLDVGEVARACADAERAVQASAVGRNAQATAARARALSLSARALVANGDVDRAAPLAEESLKIARALSDACEECRAEGALAEIHRARGDEAEALKRSDRAHAAADRADSRDVKRAANVEAARLLFTLGDAARATEMIDRATSDPDSDPSRAVRTLCLAARIDRGAGLCARALDRLDHAATIANRAPSARALAWLVAAERIATYLDLGAIDVARETLSRTPAPDSGHIGARSRRLALEAQLALASGDRPDAVARLATEALAEEGVPQTTRAALSLIHAYALATRGRYDDAERIAIGLTAEAAKTGTRVVAAHGLGIAARAGNPDAWLLRWLGALSLASGGVAARVEHESLAALSTEPDPIGRLARTGLVIVRARIVDRAPVELRSALRHSLKQAEGRIAQLRVTKRVGADTSLDDDTLRALEKIGIAGSSPLLMRTVATVARASKSGASLVLVGETGAGKELFARLAHALSSRKNGPFVAVNCAAIPEPLLEAELFGHERGAFTGAERARRGLFVEAEGGALFLDEVGEMSAAMQVKLLRVLEDGEVRAVGGTRSRKVDVRVLAATHRDLTEMVAARTFREDLFYRLAAIVVRVPSLRERPEDLPAITRAVLTRDPTTRLHRLDVPGLTALTEHHWPGNVRELANVLRVAAALAESNVIGRPELTRALASGRTGALGESAGPGPSAGVALRESTLRALRARHKRELKELVGRAIAAADGNKLRAAEALGVSRQGLYRVLESVVPDAQEGSTRARER